MIYNLLRGFLYPFIFISILFSKKKFNFIFSRLFQNFSTLDKSKEYIWIHCSSVGEINLTDSLVKKILDTKSENILITVFTDTGFATAKDKYSKYDKVSIFKFPIDDYFVITRIANSIKLNYLILVETEIWPNLIKIVSRKTKVILINGRISNKSLPRYKKVKALLKPILNKISIFCMQSEADSDRIIMLGADKNRVVTTGNLKFDISFENYVEAEKNSLKKLINLNNRKLFVAGSTRQGEDSILIDVSTKLDNTLLAIVPRHLERVGEIEEIIKSKGLTYKKLSDIETNSLEGEVDIILVDKMGVLRKFYSICDYAFVGGTLVDIGGHSLLEPLFYGKTPIFGPYLQNVKTISKDILSLNLGYKVTDINEFLNAINLIEAKPVSENDINNFFLSNKNTTEKIITFMEE